MTVLVCTLVQTMKLYSMDTIHGVMVGMVELMILSTGGASVATGGMTSGSSFSDTLCLPTGCYDVTVGGGSYDSEISFDFGSLVGAAAGTYTDISSGGAVCIVVVNGCTDSLALKLRSIANTDDGSCNTVYGCTDPTAFNYDSTATVVMVLV